MHCIMRGAVTVKMEWLGKKKKEAANKKRKEYYETQEGKETKRKYAEKDRRKHNLIQELRMMKKVEVKQS